MKATITAALLAMLVSFSVGQTSPKNHVPQLTPDQWREDLHVLATEIAQRHKNAFAYTRRKEFELAVAKLDKQIPRLRGYEVMIGMMRILAMVGDGHTRCDDLFNSFSQFPIDLYWFGNGMRVIRAAPKYKEALGGRVIAIGTTPIAVAAASVRTLIEKHETEGWVERFSAFYLTSPEILKHFGIISDLDYGTYVIEKGGRKASVTVKSIAYNAEPKYLDAADKVPLYRMDTNEVWFEYWPNEHLTYFAFNFYPAADEFRTVAADLFKILDAHRRGALAIDFRNNGGGDYIRFDEVLLEGLKQRAGLHSRGRLYALIGRKTFSAAMMNALQLKQQMNAILVGEPTGARPNSYSEAAHFNLPNSHFQVEYSTKYYRLVSGDPPGIIPDKLLPPTWQDYKAGTDSALDWIEKELTHKQK